VIITTTASSLHSENETRLFSIPLADSQEQTRQILLRQAQEDERQPARDLSTWHTLQIWLEGQSHHVTIPFAHDLVRRIPPVAVRLRRDVAALLNLIRAHALLHQANRKKEAKGRVIAELTDYAVVRELVVDLLSEGVERTVSSTVRTTVGAVEELSAEDPGRNITVTILARRLGIDTSSASRRVGNALERGYLRNLESTKGKAFNLMVGDALPQNMQILPEVETLTEAAKTADAAEEPEYEEGDV